MTKQLLAALTVSVAVVVAGCQSEPDEQAGEGKQASAEDAQQLGGTALATVNGETITQAMLQQHLDQRSGGRNGEVDAQMKRDTLNELVDMTLMAQAAKDEGYADKPDVQARLESIRRAVLAQAMVQGMDPQNAVTDEEIQAAYEEQYEGDLDREYHARHILVDEEATAKDLIEQLNDGAEFAALAEEHSTGPTSEKGGDLGWFSPDQMVPPFAKAAQELDKGEITQEPVKTRFGWHVIKLEGVRESEPPALEEVSDQLRSQLAREKIEQTLADLREKGEINFTDEAPSGADGQSGETAADDGEMSDETMEQDPKVNID